jgi:hypothetical protein
MRYDISNFEPSRDLSRRYDEHDGTRGYLQPKDFVAIVLRRGVVKNSRYENPPVPYHFTCIPILMIRGCRSVDGCR